MANETIEKKAGINALGAKAAYNLANVTKTKPGPSVPTVISDTTARNGCLLRTI